MLRTVPSSTSSPSADSVAVTPVFSASYSGLFKSFFDVLDEGTLAGKPVLLGATAGTERHSLALEFAVRPLFAYLRANVEPTAVVRAKPILEAKGLKVWFPVRTGLFMRTTGHFKAVDDIDIEVREGSTYRWEAASTYIRKPPFFDNLGKQPQPLGKLGGGGLGTQPDDQLGQAGCVL